MNGSKYRRFALSICATVPLLSGCGGLPPPIATRNAIEQIRHPLSRPTCPCLYVTNGTPGVNPSVLVFPVGAKGNSPPTRDITGSKTELYQPTAVAVDRKGNIYVTDWTQNAIFEYAAGANGDKPPKVVISGYLTGLNEPDGIALDKSGNMYVSNYYGYISASGFIEEFAAGSNGDVAPRAVISGYYTGFGELDGVALDSEKNIYTAVRAGSGTGAVEEFAAGSNGDVAPIATISGSLTDLDYPTSLTLDASANLYVSNYQVATVYRAGSNGNVPPIEAISGKKTKMGSLYGIALDSTGNIYVSSERSGLRTKTAILEFAVGANGNAKPVGVLAGKRSALDNPQGIAIR